MEEYAPLALLLHLSAPLLHPPLLLLLLLLLELLLLLLLLLLLELPLPGCLMMRPSHCAPLALLQLWAHP